MRIFPSRAGFLWIALAGLMSLAFSGSVWGSCPQLRAEYQAKLQRFHHEQVLARRTVHFEHQQRIHWINQQLPVRGACPREREAARQALHFQRRQANQQLQSQLLALNHRGQNGRQQLAAWYQAAQRGPYCGGCHHCRKVVPRCEPRVPPRERSWSWSSPGWPSTDAPRQAFRFGWGWGR